MLLEPFVCELTESLVLLLLVAALLVLEAELSLVAVAEPLVAGAAGPLLPAPVCVFVVVLVGVDDCNGCWVGE